MIKRLSRLLFLCAGFLLAFSGSLSAQTIIADFTDATNDRFTNSSSFIGADYDFSGVATGNRWATLISDNVIIGAFHNRPVIGNGLTFYEDNDPSKAPIVRDTTFGHRIAGTDIYLAVLDEPVTPNITSYNFTTEVLSAPAFDAATNSSFSAAGSLQDEIVFTVGTSPTERDDPSQNQAVGRNRIAGYVEDLPFQGTLNNDSLLLIQDQPNRVNFVEHESRFQGGDSGAPLFIERDGELVLLGVNSFTASGVFSGVSFIGNHADEINDFILDNAVVPSFSQASTLSSVSTVPEPSVFGLGLLAMAVLGFKRRK